MAYTIVDHYHTKQQTILNLSSSHLPPHSHPTQRTDRELASLTTKRDRLLQEAKEMEEKHETAKRALERFNREIARLARDVEAGAPATAEECAEMAGRIKVSDW